MIKTLKTTIKDEGYIAANKDWLDSMLEDTFCELPLPDHVTWKMVTDAFYKDMTHLSKYKDKYPTCIMFRDHYIDCNTPLSKLGQGIVFIHDYSDADRFRDFCVSSITAKSGLRTPFFDRGLCNAIRAIIAEQDFIDRVGENEYIRYALPFPLSRLEGGCHDLDVELIAFEHEGFVQLVIPHIDTEEDFVNLRGIVGSCPHVYFFGVYKALDGIQGEWKLHELSKVLARDALLVKFYTKYRGTYDPVKGDVCFYG